MFTEAHLYFTAIALVASLISAVFGFGTAILLLAGGALFLPVPETIALATLIFTSNTVIKSWIHRAHIDWGLTLRMSLTSLPFAYLGAELMILVPGDWLKKGLAILILMHVAWQILKQRPAFHPSHNQVYGISCLYGFLSGLIGTGNLVKAVFLDRAGFDRHSFVGVMAATSVLANVVKLISYSGSGLLTSKEIPLSFLLIFVSVITALMGRSILGRISARHFKTGLQIILIFVSVSLLVT